MCLCLPYQCFSQVRRFGLNIGRDQAHVRENVYKYACFFFFFFYKFMTKYVYFQRLYYLLYHGLGEYLGRSKTSVLQVKNIFFIDHDFVMPIKRLALKNYERVL